MRTPRDVRRFAPITPVRFAQVMNHNPELRTPPAQGLARLVATQWVENRYDQDGHIQNGREDMPPATTINDPAPWLVDLRGQVKFQMDNVPMFAFPEDMPRLVYPPPGIQNRYLALRYAQKDQGDLGQLSDDDPSWQSLEDGYLEDVVEAHQHFDWAAPCGKLPHVPSPLLHASIHVRVPRAPLTNGPKNPLEELMRLEIIQQFGDWRRMLSGIMKGSVVPLVMPQNRPTTEGLLPNDAWIPVSLQALLTALEGLLNGRAMRTNDLWKDHLLDPVPLAMSGYTHDATPIFQGRRTNGTRSPEMGWVCVAATWTFERMDGTHFAKPVALFIPGKMAWDMAVGALYAQETHGAMLLAKHPPPQCGYAIDPDERRRILDEEASRRNARRKRPTAPREPEGVEEGPEEPEQEAGQTPTEEAAPPAPAESASPQA
jgi:hypothetical protein